MTDKAAELYDKVRPAKGMEIPKDVAKRVQRSRQGLESVVARRRESEEFARNNHYVEVDKSGLKLEQKSTVSVSQGGEKLNHRVRKSEDVLAPILKGKISAATQRIPGYEVVQTTNDWEDYSAARLAKNIAAAGYELWAFKEGFRRACWLSLVTEEAFIMPFWDSTIGPYIEVPPQAEGEEPDYVGMGDVRLAVYGGTEVSWEPGVQFEDSPYYVIEHARSIEALEKEVGYIGGKLKADAETSATGPRKGAKGADMAIVTEYLERPCRAWPDGRRMVMAQGRQLFAEEKYPLCDEEDQVVDAPCLHRLYYAVDGASDRAKGLVQSLVETVRRYDFFNNKAAEYIQIVMTPQLLAPEGAITTEEITDEPGSIIEYDPSELTGNGKIEWRTIPAMPSEFRTERDFALAQLGHIANDNPVSASVESGKEVEALVQKDILAWQDFIEQLAEVHAAVMRDALVLVQLYYTEQRMVKFRGRTGWEALSEFKGADIRGQTDVRVQPGSLEPLTRGVIEQRIMNVNSMFQGYFPPEVIVAALAEGNFDRLNESFEAAEEQANFIIAQIRAGTFWELPKRRALPGEEVPRLDVESGQPEWQVPPQFDAEGQPLPGTGIPVMEEMVSGWMPRPFDNLPVIRRRFETFMSSDEWRHLDGEAQEATGLVYHALLGLEADKQAKAALQQNQTAEELGAQNAAKPQQPKPLPSLPGAETQPAASGQE